MAYDLELADRLRELLADQPDLVEKRMFGGLAFMVGGHMVVGASGQGGLLLRVAPDLTETLLADPAARPMEMRGREMTGWLYVDLPADAPAEELRRWIGYGLAHVATLPPK